MESSRWRHSSMALPSMSSNPCSKAWDVNWVWHHWHNNQDYCISLAASWDLWCVAPWGEDGVITCRTDVSIPWHRKYFDPILNHRLSRKSAVLEEVVRAAVFQVHCLGLCPHPPKSKIMMQWMTHHQVIHLLNDAPEVPLSYIWIQNLYAFDAIDTPISHCNPYVSRQCDSHAMPDTLSSAQTSKCVADPHCSSDQLVSTGT